MPVCQKWLNSFFTKKLHFSSQYIFFSSDGVSKQIVSNTADVYDNHSDTCLPLLTSLQ